MNVSVETPLGFVKRGAFVPGKTIAEIYREQGLSPAVPVVCLRNGKPLLRARKRRGKVIDYRRWEITRARRSDTIAFVCPLREGDTGKNVLRTVAIIGLAVAAAFAAPLVGAAIGITGTLGVAAIQAGIVIGGSFLLSTLMPVKPAASDPTSSTSQAAVASPTYSLTPSGNQARLLAPIPRQYGRMRIVPDFVSQPYTKYNGNEQYIFETFSLGIGTYQQHEVRIGDMIVWTEGGGYSGRFTQIDIAFYGPNAPLTLFQTGVDVSSQVANQELRQFSIGPITISSLNVFTITPNEATGFSFHGFKTGDAITLTGASPNDGTYFISNVNTAGQLTTSNNAISNGSFPGSALTLLNNVGPYPASRNARTTNTVELDFVFPGGLGHVEDDGSITSRTVTVVVQRRIIDPSGNPVGGFANIGTFNYSANSATPQRFSETITGLGANIVEILVTRTTANTTLARDLLEMHWTGLKGFYADDDQYPTISIMQIRARVGSELTAASSQSFSVVQTAKLPIWNGSTWSAPTVTRSIAWAAADLLRNAEYGMGLSDDLLDLQRLLDLEATWAGRGDLFNGVFDTQQSAWDALKTILACGRTKPVLVASIVTFVRDAPSALAQGVFTPRNMRKGSAEFTHILVDANTPDDVIVEFFNEDTWSADEVQCTLPGSSSTNPARVTLFGVTNYFQARREGFFLAAGNAYRRVMVTVNSELEGKLLINGDTIIIAHDAIAWGQSGEIADYDGDAEITLSNAVSWAGGDQDYLVLSTAVNKEWGPVLVRQKPGYTNVAVVDPISRAAVEAVAGSLTSVAQFNLADTQMAMRYVLGVGSTDFKRCKVISVLPQDMSTIQILAAVDDDRVYVN